MRILMLALRSGYSIDGQPVGGVTNNLLRLCSELQNRGHETTILTSLPDYPEDPNSKNNRKRVDQTKIPIISVKPIGKYPGLLYGLSFFVLALIQCKRLQQHYSFEIIHGHSAFPFFGLLARLIGIRLKLPTMLTLYSPIRAGLNLETYLKYLQNPWIVRNIFLNHVICIATSQFVRQSLLRIGVRKIFMTYPFIDFSQFKPISEEIQRSVLKEIGLDKKSFIILYLGNTTKTKGLFDLFKALRKTKQEIDLQAIQLIIALDMPRQNSEKLLQPICDEIGFANPPIHIGISPQINEIMASSDLVAIPFRNTFGPADPPLSILEAMATGTTVLTTKVGGLVEIIDDNVSGILVNPGSYKEISEKIIESLRFRDKLNKMGLKGAIMIREILENNQQITEHLHAYRFAGLNVEPAKDGSKND